MSIVNLPSSWKLEELSNSTGIVAHVYLQNFRAYLCVCELYIFAKGQISLMFQF